jgi:hypothetical protein
MAVASGRKGVDGTRCRAVGFICPLLFYAGSVPERRAATGIADLAAAWVLNLTGAAVVKNGAAGRACVGEGPVATRWNRLRSAAAESSPKRNTSAGVRRIPQMSRQARRIKSWSAPGGEVGGTDDEFAKKHRDADHGNLTLASGHNESSLQEIAGARQSHLIHHNNPGIMDLE